jgi:hypothetical protein
MISCCGRALPDPAMVSRTVVGHVRALTIFVGALHAFACGGSSKTENRDTDSGGSSGSGGSAGQPVTGGSSTGGTAGDSGAGEGGAETSGGSGGFSGSSGVAGAAGAGDGGGGAGTGGRGSVPGETPEETDILRPLGTSDAALDAAAGQALVEIMQEIGLARGYAMCRCFYSPSEAPDTLDDLAKCARAEIGFGTIARPDGARCIAERAQELPEFSTYLRCEARRLRENGLDWTTVCEAPGSVPPLPGICERPEGASEVIVECDSTVYCADEAVVVGFRCDSVAHCEDLSDERSCYDLTGQDQLTCDGEISSPLGFCHSECGAMATPPLCDPERPGSFVCADGSALTTDVVCDRVEDCANGADEAHCLR